MPGALAADGTTQSGPDLPAGRGGDRQLRVICRGPTAARRIDPEAYRALFTYSAEGVLLAEALRATCRESDIMA